MSLAELSEQSGVPGRTIRYYIARGVMPGPLKAGRDAAYGAGHLERLKAIEELQARGLTLMEIARQLAGGPRREALQPVACWQYQVADDVVVTVRAGVSPWRLKQIGHQLAQMAAALGGLEQN